MSVVHAAGPTLGPATVRRRLRRFARSFAPYRRELVERHGEDTAARVEEATRREYAALLPRTPRFPVRFNVFNWILGFNALIASLFKSLRAEGHTAEESARVLFAVTEGSLRPTPRILGALARRFFFSRLFLALARRSARRVREHPGGWTIEYRRGDGRTSHWYFECSDCGVVKFLRAHGAAELTPYCNYVDFLQSRAFGLGMQNPENIGRGSDVCRELFLKGRETPLPDNLRGIAGEEGATARHEDRTVRTE